MTEEITIHRFDATYQPPDELLQGAAELFARNYPAMHEPDERAQDIAARSTPEQFRELLKTRVLRLAVDTRQQVVGLLESGEVDKGHFIYALLAWIMTDESVRQKKVGSALHAEFEAEAEEIRVRTGKYVDLTLNVHEDNPARAIYREKWGYVEDTANKPSRPKKLFMTKEQKA